MLMSAKALAHCQLDGMSLGSALGFYCGAGPVVTLSTGTSSPQLQSQAAGVDAGHTAS